MLIGQLMHGLILNKILENQYVKKMDFLDLCYVFDHLNSKGDEGIDNNKA
jgi:hypothetical protein